MDLDFRTCEHEVSSDQSKSTTADTNGWDTLYVVRAGVINTALKAHFDKLLAEGELRMEELLESDLFDLRINATFGAWQVCGGAGGKVQLALPITSGVATIEGRKKREVDLTKTVVTVEVSLGYHAPPNIKPGEPIPAQLRILFDRHAPSVASSSNLKAPGSQPVKPQDEIRVVGIEGQGFDRSLEPTICAGIKDWLLARKDLFDYMFLSVNIAEEAATGDFQWIKPTTVSYAVAHIPATEQKAAETLFAVLAMTESRKLATVTDMVPVNAIPLNEKANAAFLIGPHLIIEKFVRPKLHTLFENAKPEHFKIAPNNGLVIQNVEEVKLKLQLDPEWYSGAEKEAIATIPKQNFSVKVDGRVMTIAFRNVRFPYGGSDEIDIQMSYECSSFMGLDPNDHFAFKPAEPPMSTLSVAQNQEKMAKEALKTIGWTLVAQIGTAIVFHGLGKLAGKAVSALKGTGNVVTRAAGEEVAVVEKNVMNAINIERQAVGNSAVMTLTATESTVWSTVGAGLRKTGIGVLEFVQSGLTNSLVIMMVGQMAGSVYGERSQMDLISALREDPKKMDSMAHFADHCVSPIVWPNTKSASMVCAGLNHAFTIALEVKV